MSELGAAGAAGGAASGAKSQLEMDPLFDEDLAPVVHDRVAEVLARFTSGARLKKEQLQVVAHLLPVEVAPYSKQVTQGVFAKSYREYEAVYGKKMRTIKWWVEQGKAHKDGPDLPPLDAPKEMPAWWQRIMKQRCPKSVLAAAKIDAAVAAPPVSPSAVGGVVAAPPPRPPAPSKLRPESLEISSQEDRLAQLKEQLAIARFEMLEAQAEEPADAAKILARQQHWRELREETDKAEEKLFKARRDAGRLVDQDEVAAVLMPMLATVATSVRTLIVRLKPRLRTATSDAEEDAIWNAGLDECFAELIEGGFMARQSLHLVA